MPSYSELNKLPADSFLQPELFRTHYDVSAERREATYRKGLADCKDFREVFINSRGTWGAHTIGGGLLTAYEGIGYHAYTADLLRAFLDSGVPVYVYRDDYDGDKFLGVRRYRLYREGGLFGAGYAEFETHGCPSRV